MRHLATALNALAFLWVSAATTYLLATAGDEGANATSVLSGHEAVVGHVSVSLGSANGAWVFALLVGVSLLAVLPFGVALNFPERHRPVTWSVGLLLLGFSLISGFSVGLVYLPGALALLASAASSVMVQGDAQTPPMGHRSAA
jgi:hypothetical protein